MLLDEELELGVVRILILMSDTPRVSRTERHPVPRRVRAVLQ